MILHVALYSLIGIPPGAITLSPDAPAALWVEGEPVVFALKPDTAEYRVVDYGGAAVGSGSVKDGRLRLDAIPPGYYELECVSGSDKARMPFGVIAKPRQTAAAPIAVDAASAWLAGPSQWEPLARMLHRAGIDWVRERFSWSEVQPIDAGFTWGRYDTVAKVLADQKVNTYQIFHDSPGWTHPGSDRTRNPDDLRTVYRFAKAAGKHFAGRIQAWEVWNEPDIEFWPDLSDRFAGVQKAAYLGLKAGDPNLSVLLASLCQGPTTFSQNLLDCGVADYFDIFNIHIYGEPRNYPGIVQRHRKQNEPYGVNARPIWLSEAGIRLVAKDNELTPTDLHRQAEFIPKSLVMSLVAGIDRHFVFVLCDYMENGIQFGLIHKDLSPRPAWVALVAAARVLGEARYLGRWAIDAAGIEAYLFNSGQEIVAALWASESRNIEVDLASDAVTVVDLLGRARTVKTRQGRLRLTVDRAAQYVVGLPRSAATVPASQPRAAGILPANKPCPVVMRGYAVNVPHRKTRDAYVIDPTQPIDYRAEICNLDESQIHDVVLKTEPPRGWTIEPDRWQGQLDPMGREVISMKIRPQPSGGLDPSTLRLTGQADGQPIARSISTFMPDPAKLPPASRRSLAAGEPTAWKTNISGNGTMTVSGPDPGVVRFDIRFTAPGDRWAYPVMQFQPSADLHTFEGIAFDYRCAGDDDQTHVRLQIIESGGSAYAGVDGLVATKQWRRAIVPFAELRYGDYSPKDANGRLDLDRVASLMIGCNTPRNTVMLEVRNVEAVSFTRSESAMSSPAP